jgi:hypothetical protein
MDVFVVRAQMFREIFDPLCEKSYLNFCGPSIAVVKLVFLDDLGLLVLV